VITQSRHDDEEPLGRRLLAMLLVGLYD